MPAVLEILQELGASRQRDGTWRLDLRALRLTSIFGGPLQGEGALTVRGDDVTFARPAELAVCDGISLRGLDDADGLRELITDLHGDMRARANAHLATLRRLGFKPALSAPVPRPRADVAVAGGTATVSISGSGQLVIDAVDGVDVPPTAGTLTAAAGLTQAEALRRIGAVVDELAHRAAATNAGEQLSQDQLDELHNALHDELDDSDDGGAFDDDDAGDAADDDDEYEPTVAGVPPPQRRDDVRLAPRGDEARPAGVPEWDGGTAPVAARTAARPTMEQLRPGTLEVGTAELIRTMRPMPPVTVPVSPTAPRNEAPARGTDLLDEFDDDDGAAPAGDDEVDDDGFELVEDDASIDDDDDDDDGGASDPLGNIATEALPAPRPAVAVAAVAGPAPPAAIAPKRSIDDEENDLLAALGGDDDVAPGAPDDALAGRPTTISVTPRGARDMVSAAPARSPTRASSPIADDHFAGDAEPAQNVRHRAERPSTKVTAPPPMADDDFGAAAGFDDDGDGDDDFADAKTRALSVDVALLDRLKRGDGQLPSVDGGDDPDEPRGHATESVRTGALLAGVMRTLGGAAAHATFDAAGNDRRLDGDVGSDEREDKGNGDADGFDAHDVVTHVGNGESRTAVGGPPPAGTVAPLAPVEPVKPVKPVESVEPVPRAVPPRPVLATREPAAPAPERPRVALAELHVPVNDDDDDDDDASEAELAALRLRATTLRNELDGVLARIAALEAARESTTTRPAPPTTAKRADLVAMARPARLSALAGVELPSHADPSGVAAPPVLTDEGEFAAVGQSEDEGGVDSATTPLALPSPAADADAIDDAFDDAFASGKRDDDQGDDGDDGDDVDEDGVSLADLQGALREMGVDVEGAGTQVKALAVPNDDHAAGDDGDVFGTGGAGSAGDAGEDDLLVDEPTNIRPPRPGTIALVVEDSRARDRLKKHLEPRFAALFEAVDAQGATELDDLDIVDAIVFVRPSRSETNEQGFARIDRMARRPRVLVLSGDVAFDERPGVDLRLPLGQKASEVARQVLEGLERLGVQAAAE
jgi:hypothetical protein